MRENRKAGWALIAGSVFGIMTMAIHPVGGGPMSVAQVNRLALVSGIAHSLGIVSFVSMFLGAVGLGRWLAAKDQRVPRDCMAFAGVVVLGFGCVAILIATSVSGFIVPRIIQHMAHDSPDTHTTYRLIVSAVFEFNQAFAQIYTVMASVAIVLWSAAALRSGGLGRGISIYGCVTGPLLAVLVAVGHVRLDVHGMAVVVLAQAVWLVTAGVQMMKDRSGEEVTGAAY